MSAVLVKHPGGVVSGTVHLPASKSLANRLLLMRAVAGFSDLTIKNLSNARDTRILNEILQHLDSSDSVDVHDAGTVMRFLTAYLSCVPGQWVVTGAPRMKERPIGALVDVLQKLGADISYTEKKGFPPLLIKGKQLTGGPVEIDGSVSSQFLSALLMIAPLYKNPLELIIKGQLVSVPYVKMTIDLMKQWGAEVDWTENRISVRNTPYKKPDLEVFVESDWSAASYFYSVLALADEGEIILPYLYQSSLQGDSVCAKLFEEFGVYTIYKDTGVVITRKQAAPNKFNYNFIECPDIAQTLAVCCAGKKIPANLEGLKTLKVKETDRIEALKAELEKYSSGVVAGNDSLQINPSQSGKKETVRVATYNDHRMAMSFAPLGLHYTLIIENPAVVEKSFPHFWEELKKLGFGVNEM